MPLQARLRTREDTPQAQEEAGLLRTIPFRVLRRMRALSHRLHRLRPVAGAGAALDAAGAWPVGGTARRFAMRGAWDGVIWDGSSPADAGCLAVVACVAMAAGVLDLRLVGPDGAVLDRVRLEAPAGRRDIMLLAPVAAGLRLVAMAGPALVRIVGAGVWAVPAAAFVPEAVIPRRALAPDADWPQVYGPIGHADSEARLREVAFRRMERAHLVSMLDGIRLWLEPGDELSRAVLISGTYEPETLLAMRSLLPEGGGFVDVGAHCGVMSLFAARCVGPRGRVLAFEPSPREFARLEANLAANVLPQVTTRQAAVADVAGSVTLRMAEAGRAGHNTIGSGFAHDGVAVAALAQVEAATLDAALATFDRCDLVKMDIEGAELRALRGGEAALARLRPALILEVFDRALAGSGDTETALFAWLEAQGYAVRDIDPASGRFDEAARPMPGISRNIVAVPVR